MTKYALNLTANYPDGERDYPLCRYKSRQEMIRELDNHIANDRTATSFVVTIVKVPKELRK